MLRSFKRSYFLPIHISIFTTLYVSGLFYWIYYFNGGSIELVSSDWVKEAAYLNTLRDAVSSGTIPWYWNETFYHSTTRFLANPEFVATPDIVFLPWVSNGVFVTLHTIIFYTAGFIAMLLWMKKLRLSLLPILFFWLLFNFNGYLGAHLSVGHFQWTGYFLLPFFFLIVYEFLQGSEKLDFSPRLSMAMGLLLGVLIMNGSVHLAVWCIMFLMITTVWKWKIYRHVIVSIVLGLLLGAGRLIPAALWFPQKSHFISGYPDLHTLIDAFTVIRDHNYPETGGVFGTLGWWEYDIYIGFTAFTIFIFVLVFTLKNRIIPNGFVPLLLTAMLLLFFSVGDSYALICNSPLPFSSVERVSSRFIVMPFVVFLLLSSFVIQKIVCSKSFMGKFSFSIALFFVAYELYLHSIKWKMVVMEKSFQVAIHPSLHIVDHPDIMYHVVLTGSWVLSLGVLIIVIKKSYF